MKSICFPLACFTMTILSAVQLIGAEAGPARTVLTVESESLRLSIGADAHTLEFTDKLSGVNYIRQNPAAAFATLKKGGKAFDATKAALIDGRLVLDFGDAAVEASLRVVGQKHSVTVEVLSVTGEGVEEFVFVDAALTLKGLEEEPFAACALALNLQTDVEELPGAMSRLRAVCYPRFGFAGAKVALIGCRQNELRRAMQEVVSAAPELPHSPIGGPWAMDSEANRGSYLFANVSERTADDWIKLARGLGLNQIDFDGMSRYGDAEPFPSLYPHGRAGLKAVVDKVHAAGLKAGLHTYSFFMDKKCPWVTPVPDARLAKDASFTLSEALDAASATVYVAQPTTRMSPITGFFVRNSATIQVDDELIEYSDVSQAAPYAFGKCRRGACGTRPAAHASGAQVHHLKECFGRFVPDGDSTLLPEVAAATARTFNESGFDMMYLDALDGEDILEGRENAWHYGSKFVFELWKRLDHPALLEMSTFQHHLWCLRSRLGAWDNPARSKKRFIDIHCADNASESRMFLPMHLGWWAVQTWTGPQGEPTFSDDMDYLCGKAIGNDVGISLQGITPDTFANNATMQRLAGITRQYEQLRHAGYFPESIKARLRVPGAEFTLGQSPVGKWQLRPANYAKHTVGRAGDAAATWTVTNAFAPQPLKVRLEVLMSAEPYDAASAITMADFKNANEFSDHIVAEKMSASLEPSSKLLKEGASSGLIRAVNSGRGRVATWAKFGKNFTPPLNLGGERALGVWIHGDGGGEVLNFQLLCAEHLAAGVGEHYCVVDFTGWRYFEMIEPEGERYANYSWPYGNDYQIYRESVDYKQIGQLNIWINNLPAGGVATCSLSPVRAMPLVKAIVRNPRLTVGNQTLRLPVAMESGSYAELTSSNSCKVFGPDGNQIQDVKIDVAAPMLAAGANQLHFECDAAPGPIPRVRLTTITVGSPLDQ